MQRQSLEFQALFESIRDGIIVVDQDRVITNCNQATAELFGYSCSELAGQPTQVLFADNEEFEAVGRRMQAEAGNPKKVYVCRYKKKDGTPFLGEKSIQILYDQHGKRQGFIGIVRDVSERVEAENRIQALLRDKELLLGEVHHRVKNNLSSVHSLLSLQAANVEDSAAEAALRDAAGRVRTMLTLYEQLGNDNDFHTVSLRSYLSSLLSTIRGTLPPSFRISVKFSGTCYDAWLDGNTVVAVGMIVNELLTNAAKHAFPEGGSGELKLRVGSGDGRCVLEFHDNGVGLPRDVLEGRRSGFGLTLVRALAQQIDAELTLEAGSGSVTRLSLPAQCVKEEDEQ